MPKAKFMLTQKSVVLHHCTNVHEINTETLTSCFFVVKLCSRIHMQILKFYRTPQKLIRKCIIKYTNYNCCNYWSFCAALIIKKWMKLLTINNYIFSTIFFYTSYQNKMIKLTRHKIKTEEKNCLNVSFLYKAL